LEAISLTAAVAQLVQMGAQGIRALRKAVPAYGKFWDEFKRQLENERDIPWQAIESNCYLQPDFVGWAIAYIAGDDKGRRAMEAHFAGFLEPPEGARLDKTAIVAHVSDAARNAANAAASDDRKAALADSRLVVAALLKAIGDLESGIQEVQADTTAIRESLDTGVAEILSRLPEERDEKIGRAEGASPPPFSLNSAEIDALLERAGEVFLEKQRQVQAEEADARVAPQPLPQPATAPALPTTPGLDALSQQDHLERLRELNAAAATQVEEIVRDGGVLALATALRTDTLPHDLDTLVAAARIVAASGFLSEAEHAFLRASALDLDGPTRARQLVRAARLADVQGAQDRTLQHLQQARHIDSGNSALAITEACRSRDGAYMLERLAEVEPIDDDERAVLHQTRAQAHLSLGDDEAARREYELAKEASPTNVSVREFGGIRALHEAQQRASSGGELELETLRQAGEMFEGMAADLLRENRPIEAGAIIARAAEAFMLGRQFERASTVLRRLPARDLLPDEVALSVAQTAMVCQEPELVLRLLPEGADEPLAQLLRAEARAEVPEADEATLAEAVTVLESFMRGENDELAKRAAFSLLDVSVRRKEAEWSEEAAEIVRADRPDTAAAMRAERHLLLGEFEEAEAALLPVATTSTYQRRLRDYAALAGNWPKVVDRSRQLLRDWSDPRDRLALGHALSHTDGSDAAFAEFLRVARDGSADDGLLDEAFGAAMEIAGADRNYGAVLELATEWREALPESSNALWNVLFGLARLSQHSDAYALAQEVTPDASTPERATLLAEIYYRAAPRREAIATIASLSDRYERRIEALEALVIGAALGADEAELDEPLRKRVADTIATFEERFPDSETIRSIPAPKTAEEFEALLKELAGDRPAIQAQMFDAVRDGRAPINAAAALSPGRVATTWRDLIIWPLGFATAEQDAADRGATANALGGAAVLDPSSIVVLSALPQIKDKALAALPGSAIANETLEDVDSDTQPSGRRVAQTEHRPDGSVTLREVTPEEEAATAEQSAEALRTAKSLAVLPPFGDSVSEDIKRLYGDSEEKPDVQVLAATIALAQRLGRPIYTDDRWIREFARAVGVEAFGTVALLDVLRERGVISNEDHIAARLALTERGAWGISLTGEELIAAGRAASFDLNRTLIGAFHDRAAWRARPAERFQAFGGFLGAVFDERPDRFEAWLHRVLDAAHTAAPHMPRSWFAEALLLMCWGLGDTDPQLSDPCFHTLVEDIKRLPPWLTTLGYDAVLGTIRQFLSMAHDRPGSERFLFFCLIVRRLRFFDSVRAINTFVR
jgi:hypothetical protein